MIDDLLDEIRQIKIERTPLKGRLDLLDAKLDKLEKEVCLYLLENGHRSKEEGYKTPGRIIWISDDNYVWTSYHI